MVETVRFKGKVCTFQDYIFFFGLKFDFCKIYGEMDERGFFFIKFWLQRKFRVLIVYIWIQLMIICQAFIRLNREGVVNPNKPWPSLRVGGARDQVLQWASRQQIDWHSAFSQSLDTVVNIGYLPTNNNHYLVSLWERLSWRNAFQICWQPVAIKAVFEVLFSFLGT